MGTVTRSRAFSTVAAHHEHRRCDSPSVGLHERGLAADRPGFSATATRCHATGKCCAQRGPPFTVTAATFTRPSSGRPRQGKGEHGPSAVRLFRARVRLRLQRLRHTADRSKCERAGSTRSLFRLGQQGTGGGSHGKSASGRAPGAPFVAVAGRATLLSTWRPRDSPCCSYRTYGQLPLKYSRAIVDAFVGFVRGYSLTSGARDSCQTFNYVLCEAY